MSQNKNIQDKTIDILNKLGVSQIGKGFVYPGISKSYDTRKIINYDTSKATEIVSELAENQTLTRLNALAKGNIAISIFPQRKEVMNFSPEKEGELIKMLEGTEYKLVQPIDAGRKEYGY